MVRDSWTRGPGEVDGSAPKCVGSMVQKRRRTNATLRWDLIQRYLKRLVGAPSRVGLIRRRGGDAGSIARRDGDCCYAPTSVPQCTRTGPLGLIVGSFGLMI